jgi:hypothetical protein
MYNVFLLLHSWNRWIVLVCGMAAVIGAFVNLKSGMAWRRSNDRASLVFLIAADVQLLLGVTLFTVGPPWFVTFMRAPAAAMTSDLLRYWTIEHGFGMIVAIIFAHIGRASIRRHADPLAKNRSAAIWLTLSLVTMLLTVPWPFMPYGRPLARM